MCLRSRYLKQGGVRHLLTSVAAAGWASGVTAYPLPRGSWRTVTRAGDSRCLLRGVVISPVGFFYEENGREEQGWLNSLLLWHLHRRTNRFKAYFYLQTFSWLEEQLTDCFGGEWGGLRFVQYFHELTSSFSVSHSLEDTRPETCVCSHVGECLPWNLRS